MNAWEKTALVLANIGAINWGLAELKFDLVQKAIVPWATATAGTIIYYVIAVCGLFAMYKLFSK